MTKEECEIETSKAIMEMRNHIEELEEKISILLSCKNCPKNKGGLLCQKEYEDKCLSQKIQYIKELKEEMQEQGLALQSDMDKTIEQNIQLKKELNKANEWNRVDEGKYPNKEQLGESFIVAFAFNEKTQEYYSFDCAEYIDKGKFCTHTNNDDKIVAWKEIVLPEGE